MKPCQMANGCDKYAEAVCTVRIDRVGDRSLCRPHADFIVAQGFGRELEPNAFKPQWLADKTFARDLTGRLA